ncbi:MAG TPA: molecular chaperone HtpG, partial [Candidatus Cloacimonas sp.]|nr:molecular chaperone HtpG [Candidatus Cloacimonas sp.]
EDKDRLQQIFYKSLDQKLEASFSKESLKEYFKKHPEAAKLLTPYQIQKDEQTIIDILELPAQTKKELGSEAMEEL